MSSKARGKRRRGVARNAAPSRFFFVAMAIALLMLGYCVAKLATVPMKVPAQNAALQR
jgi:hypothetical protein